MVSTQSKLYYFYHTRETVCAPNAAVAAAYYGSHIGSPSFTYSVTSKAEAGVAGFAIYSSFSTVICEEVNKTDKMGQPLVDGVIRPHIGGHSVPNIEFMEIMLLAEIDTEYPKCGWDITNLYEDIIKPLDQDIPYLTSYQLTKLAEVIRDRRELDDMLPSLKFLKEHHNTIYTEHMAAIICQKHQSVHDRA